jgi:hypothetical protein
MHWKWLERAGSRRHRLAVASVYLATRFELYFRVLSGRLKSDGTWVSESAQDVSMAMIGDKRLQTKRVSSVSLTYDVMKLGTSRVVPTSIPRPRRHASISSLRKSLAPTVP